MPKTGFVLGGGGSRGAYQIGVWQGLIELDIKIDVVTGTSVGALNAALVTMGDFDKSCELWRKINTSMILAVDLDETLPTKQKENLMIKQFLHDYAKNGGTDSYPLKQLLDEYCDEQIIRNSPIECGVVAVDKKTLKPLEIYKEDIKEGQLNDYLLASSSLFPAIKSCSIEDSEYIDGGYYDNLPVELAIKKGAEHIIAVDLEAVGFIRKETLKQASKLTVIKSYWNLGPILVFDNQIIKRNIRLGYLDTMKTFGAFDGIAFTFIKNEIPAYIKRNKILISKQNETLGLSYGTETKLTSKEELFHLRIGTYLKRKYSKEHDMRYTTFLKACAEAAGEIFSLDSEKIYSIQRFNEALLDKINCVEVMPIVESKGSSINNLKDKLSLFDKTVRTAYIAILIKKAILEEKTIDIFPLALLLPDEMLAAYYIALIS